MATDRCGPDAAMSDAAQRVPGFVYSSDLIAQANATEKWIAAEARKAKRSKSGWRIYACVMTATTVLLGAALDYTVPMVRLVPVFFYQDTTGIVQTAITTDSLPADLSDVNIKAWLFQYLSQRESYSYTEADMHHYVVEAMSSDAVKAAYNAEVSGKNPNSYLARYGDKAIIRISLQKITEFIPATKSKPGSIDIQYDRVLVDGTHRKPLVETWHATMRFIQDYNQGFTLSDIQSFNPSRLVVIDYPGAEKIGNTPASLTTGPNG
jgi:type IV secretory pathway component VirB8